MYSSVGPINGATAVRSQHGAVICPRRSVRHGTRGPVAPWPRVTTKLRNIDRSLTALGKSIFTDRPRSRSDRTEPKPRYDNGCRRNAPAAPKKAGPGCPSGREQAQDHVQRQVADYFVVRGVPHAQGMDWHGMELHPHDLPFLSMTLTKLFRSDAIVPALAPTAALPTSHVKQSIRGQMGRPGVIE